MMSEAEQEEKTIPDPIAGIGTMVFGKWDATDVVCEDPGLAPYINLQTIGTPHSGGRHANEYFGKANLSIIERFINNLMRSGKFSGKKQHCAKAFENALTQSQLNKARAAVREVRMSEQVEEYLVQIILATRNSDKYGGNLSDWLEFGASPRATIALDICSKSLAWLDNRNFVTPDDIRSIAHDVLRHRLILSFEAEANGISSDQVVDELLTVVPSA